MSEASAMLFAMSFPRRRESTPAYAGGRSRPLHGGRLLEEIWIPACAGMTRPL